MSKLRFSEPRFQALPTRELQVTEAGRGLGTRLRFSYQMVTVAYI